MDSGVVVNFVALMLGGVGLGTLLNLVRPRDEDAAAMHRQGARLSLAWLPDRFRSSDVRLRPAPDSGPNG